MICPNMKIINCAEKDVNTFYPDCEEQHLQINFYTTVLVEEMVTICLN